jgi:molybdate transport system ATP-binding protein
MTLALHFKSQQGSFKFDVALSLPASGTLAIYGPSGAGKSTLLNMIAGIITPNDGHLSLGKEVLFDHQKRINTPIHQRHIGLVFQDSRLFPHLNVEDNLRYGYSLLAAAGRRLSFSQIVNLLELAPLLTQKPHQLSGGEKQRVALGRALLTSPRLLLMDEPLASLDTRLKQHILPFLRRVKDELNMPMIYVSHAIDEILYLTSEIAMIEQGRLIAQGPFNQIMQQTTALNLAQSLGLENVLHTQVTSHHPEGGYSIATIDGQTLHIPLVKTAIGDQVSVSIAASNIALARHYIEGMTIQNQLIGIVQDIRTIQHKTLVNIRLASSEACIMAEVTAKSVADLQLTVGSHLYCLIKTQSIHPLGARN